MPYNCKLFVLRVVTIIAHWEWLLCLFRFYGISTLVDYLMPNTVYIYILGIYDLLANSLWLKLFSNKPELVCLLIVKWFQVLLYNTNYSIQHDSFICTQCNCSKCSNNSFFAHRWFQVFQFNTNNSIQHLFAVIHLHTVKWFQVLLFITNNLTVICLYTVK